MSKEVIWLPDNMVKIIQEIVLEFREECELHEIVRDSIFELLEKKCTVIYYPISNEKNRGFHIKKLVKDKLEDFVYINTDKTVEQQVFTATHELGHIYGVYERFVRRAKEQGIPVDGSNQDYEEKVIDRFAAELLMPEKKFMASTNDYGKAHNLQETVSILDMLKLIAYLMDEYMSPFNAVRKRLFEIKAIDEMSNDYLSMHKVKLEEYIDFLKKDENTLINSSTKVKTISGLRDFIEIASKNPNVDQILIDKIRKDFELERIDITDKINITFSGVKID